MFSALGAFASTPSELASASSFCHNTIESYSVNVPDCSDIPYFATLLQNLSLAGPSLCVPRGVIGLHLASSRLRPSVKSCRLLTAQIMTISDHRQPRGMRQPCQVNSQMSAADDDAIPGYRHVAVVGRRSSDQARAPIHKIP